MKSRPLLLLFFLAVSSSAAAQEADPKPILGVWRGTSLCVNLEATPACRDEEVVYEFREMTPPVAGKINLNADKIVDGKVVPMGAFDLAWDPRRGAWSYEIQTPRVHALWSFEPPRGDDLAGSLILLPNRTLVRKAAAHRRPKA